MSVGTIVGLASLADIAIERYRADLSAYLDTRIRDADRAMALLWADITSDARCGHDAWEDLRGGSIQNSAAARLALLLLIVFDG